MTQIAIELLDDSIPDVRTIAPPPEADAALLATIRAFGVLQPVLLRPQGNRYEIVAGRRRVRFAREAGLTEIPAEIRKMTDAEALEAQVAENTQRAMLHPIDIWRATQQLLGAGLTLTQAGLALGLSDRETRRNERLAALHPQVLALAERDMPSAEQLAVIAAAPLERQAEALKVRGAVMRRDISWETIAAVCRQTTIPRAIALFDVDKAGVVFEEDLFAEPGSPEQFVTRDVAGFLAAQRTALAAKVVKDTRAGHRVRPAEVNRQGDILLPRGWTERLDAAAKKLSRGATGPVRFVAISEKSWQLGEVVEKFADPPRPLPRPEAPAQPERVASVESISGASELDEKIDTAANSSAAPPDQAEDPESERAPVTKLGLQMIAAAKTEALRRQILRGEFPLELLAACTVLAVSAGNVHVYAARYQLADLPDPTARLVDAAGHISIDGAELRELLADTLAGMLVVTDPVTRHGSGDVAEWIGHALDAGSALPRFDTAEFLNQLSGDEVRAIARTLDISVPKKVGELRAALVGRAPDWRPASFGAPGPKPAPARRSPSGAAQPEGIEA